MTPARIHRACGGAVVFSRGNRMARFYWCEKCRVDVEEPLTVLAGRQGTVGT